MPACAAAAAPAISTGDKWRAAAAVDADERYVVANGFEADPGAQARPHADGERPARHRRRARPRGLRRSARARAYIAVRANARPPPCSGSNAAVRAAEEQGYIGTNALGAGVDVHIEVVGAARRHGRRRGDDAAPRDREQARPARPAPALSRPRRACTADRPSSTTSRRWPRAVDRGQRRQRLSPTSVTTTTRARRSSRSPAPSTSRASPRFRWA